MKINYSPVRKYKLTYEAGGRLFESTQEGMNPIDAKRRFERRVGFIVISVKST